GHLRFRPGEHELRLGRLRVPEIDGPLPAEREQRVGVEVGDVLGVALVRFDGGPDLLARHRVPAAYLAVGPAGGNRLSVRREHDGATAGVDIRARLQAGTLLPLVLRTEE